MNWSDCTHDDEVYAALKEAIAAASEGRRYPMKLTGEDYKALATAWNQGIDSHLEALTERSTVAQEDCGIFGMKANVQVHPEELPTLIRRLFEDPDRGTALANDILTTLDIETEV